MNSKCLLRAFNRTLILALLFSPGLIFNHQLFSMNGINVHAADASSAKKTRRTPAMREKIYSQLAQAQKLADENKVAEGLEILQRVKSRMQQLNSYEKAMVWNALAFIHYGNNNTQGALESFEQVIQQENIPESLELSTLFSLAQLHMQAENYPKVLTYLDRWGALKEGGLSDKALVLKANAYYAMKDYLQAEKAITLAVQQEEQQGKIAKENWLVLKRALHYELQQPEQVTSVSEKLVRHYSKPKYWVELSNMYGEVGETRKQLAVMEAAYQQGFVTKKSDFQSLAQQYYFSGAPVKAAQLLAEQLAKGKIDEDVKTLRFLAQAWSTAKENEKAVPVLQKAAQLSHDGNMDAKLAETLLNMEHWRQAIDAAEQAKKKGELENPGNVEVALGMAHYHLKAYELAIEHFKQAKKQQNVRKMAEQWLRYVEREKTKADRLKQSIAAMGY